MRIAFDMGSSGIRAGASDSASIQRSEFNYLGAVSANQGLKDVLLQTIASLRSLPAEGGFSPDCVRLGGGFSAWRLALLRDKEQLAQALAAIEAASGVAVLVIPPNTEGAYGYQAARKTLNERLNTSHVLDIGGGSLQIAGERTSFGIALGQKIWRSKLCATLHNKNSPSCAIQPMRAQELAKARRLLMKELRDLTTMLPTPVSITTISRPVTRGIWSALKRMHAVTDGNARRGILELETLTAAVGKLSRLSLEETIAQSGISAQYAGYLLSDMLLVEGIMRTTGSDRLSIAETDLNNIPSLLADNHAYAWSANYECCLERLRRIGLNAFASNPATCTVRETR